MVTEEYKRHLKEEVIRQERIPWDEESERLELSANSLKVLAKRYLRRDLEGNIIESPAQMFRRVAYHVALPDEEWGGDVEATTQKFYEMLTTFRFMPNSPTFTGAGTPLGQLAACFTEDMRVVTDKGLKRIADLQVGDRVLTHQGRFRPVTETMQRHYEGDLYRIKVKLIGVTLEVTPEHPILTPEGWVEARHLKVGDKVAVGVPRGEVPPPTFDLAQLPYAEELEIQAAIRPVDTRYVTPNASDAAQVSMPPLQSRDLIKRVFGVDLPDPDMRYVRSYVHQEGEHTFFEVEDISVVPFSGTVYNCEVDEDHTYVTEGIVVHNCFVLPISDDMGKEPDGIFMTLRNAALIQQTGGGNGFSFSRLRPKGDRVSTSAGVATGPVGFLRVYDKAFGEIAQGGCLVPETLVFTEQGVLRLDELVNPEVPGWQSHTLHVATDEGMRFSPRGYNNGVKRVLRVRTSRGLEIVGTPEHKVKVMTSDGPMWRALQDLQPGDAILVKLNQHRGQLQPLVHPERSHHNQIMPTFPAVLDEDLAFFIGYLLGDGFIARGEHDHRVGVSVSHSSYLMDEMLRLIRRLFGEHLRVRTQQKPDDASVTYVMDNRALKEFLLLNGILKPPSKDVFVPAMIRRSPRRVVAAFLRGLFEADGTLVHGYPELVTTSERLAREVATLLIGLGIPVHLSRVEAGAGGLSTTPRWRLKVVSHRGLEAWRENVGADPRSRFAAVLSFEPDLEREQSYPLPAPDYWLTPVLEAITLPQTDRRGRGQGKKFRATEPALRRQLLRYMREDRTLTLSAYERLAETYEIFARHAPDVDDLWFVHVEAVEEAGERLTLDLEVEGNHTYLAWGMVTHNTRRGANMAVLRVDHPDVFEFVRSKEKEGELTNFNISVALTDEFMRAVEEDREFNLVNPRDGKVWKTVRARDLFDEIVRHAHHNGEPGALFIDTANRDNPVPHLYELEATNPCFVGDTRIATEKGWIPIRELAESGNPFEVVTDNRAPWGGTGVPRPELGTTLRPAVKAWKTRTNAPVLRLRTRMGYTVVATPDHRFLTPDRGYVELQHLKPGDRVLLQSGEGAWSREYRLPNVETLAQVMAGMALAGDHASGHVQQRRDFVAQYSGVPREWSQDLGLVLGWLVGDGWLSPTSKAPVGMVFRSPEMLARIHGILRGWFGEGHLADRGSHYQVTYGRLPYEFFTSLGVLPVKATEKRVPESIWRAPREAVVGFLQGLFSADGSVQVNESKRDCTVRLASSSRGLLEDVQLLLLNFGIVSRIYKRRDAGETFLPDGHGGMKAYATATQYELVIGKANRDRFAALIGFADPEKHARLMAYVEGQSRGPYRETFEDVVESIEDAGTADVYDLVEPETHSLIANGLVCHNCGEQWLGPYENCCLGSINLAKHVKEVDGKRVVDWELLRQTVETAVHFLDNVVTANKYVPAVPQLKEAALRARRIGLGIMGLADMMYDLGIRYGSEEAREFAAQVMEFVRYHAMRKSIELAKERGPFPAIKGSIYDPENIKWRPPRWPDWLGGGPKTDWGRPPLDWDAIVQGIKEHGIRNAAQTTIAPTGTIATVSGCEGYGCEPVFALAYIRHFKDEDRDVELEYVSPRFMRALEEAELSEEAKRRIIDEVLRKGTCQHITELPEHIRHTFVVAQDITAEEHVYMQASLQVFVDNSISKCVVGDTLVLTSEGLVPIQSLADFRLPDQFQPLDLKVVSPEGDTRADAFYYGGYRETRRVRLQYGFQIEGTPNHRVHVLEEDGRVAFKQLDMLKPGDIVVLYTGQRRFGPPGRPLPAFSGMFRTNSKKIRFPSHMSEDLAFFLGCLTSEGAITVNGINLANQDVALLEDLNAIAERLFGLQGHVGKDPRNQVHYLQLNSRPLRHWLVADLGLVPGAANKVIPPCILQASEAEVRAFLKGLFLDAYMTEDGRLFGITLASEQLIRQLQVLLLNLGVVATVRQVTEQAWNLTVQGGELARLVEFIGFVETWKNERLARRDEGREQRYRNYSRLVPRQVTDVQALTPHPLISRAWQDDGLFPPLPSPNHWERGEGERGSGVRAQPPQFTPTFLERTDAHTVYEHLKKGGGTSAFADQFFVHDREGKVYVAVESVSAEFAEVFDIHVPEGHIFIANGLGNHNTINFPEGATVDDVKTAYFLAWRLGCKGITVYVTGTRKEVVLETRETREKKEGGKTVAPVQVKKAEPAIVPPPWNGGRQLRPRPTVLHGKTYRRPTPVGTAWITVNSDENGEPFEVFLNVGKAGSDVAADSEALGRLISLILRLPSPLSPRERLEEVIHQLSGIGGGRSMGFGPERVRSLPDAIAQVLRYHLEHQDEPEPVGTQLPLSLPSEEKGAVSGMEYGDICPECGLATFIPHEGCKRCTNCGYSEC